ncbi:GMC-family oxidoreductase [Leptospira ryugenii]|uniref:GMC-family oxidoreductase n=1 Tax=Leptospira ryugenii TaxID=1917863 RepID=A0A2P2E3I7_9LEPT|nr:GMC family oxidoreductase N-terminal domain-containing protein [Leptospira ryugenii]GBF51394.1 GMC-family oxidoreductase [Leptospira ryugenii]
MGIPQENSQIITPKKHEQIIKENAIKDGKWKLQADVVVIGSGAGGGVAAAELSKAGWKVILIEEGSYFTPAQFNSDEFISQARLYRDAGFIVSEDQTISILQGRTVGGSTTINWQTSLYPPIYVTDEWEKRFGWKPVSREVMDPFVSEVHERLGVHDVPNELVNANNNVLRVGGKKLGLNPQILKNNNRGCIGLGRCGLGCPINAKQSAFLTWIPDAISNGATVISNMKAIKIEDGSMKRVYAEFMPDAYEQAPQVHIESLEISAPVVIVSAGAIEGPALLQRSSLGNDWVGKNLKVHPTSTIFGRFDQEIKMFQGPPQSIVIKDGHNQNGTGYGYWLEAAPYRPTLASALLPFVGKQQFGVVKNYKNLNAGIVLVRDGAAGQADASVKWSFGRRKVYFNLTKEDGQNMLRGLKALAEITVAAGAKELIFPFSRMEKPYQVEKNANFDWVLQESIQSGDLSVGSAHPHGSIQSASTEEMGAVGLNLELYGHKNIFVMDASIYPTGLSVNPQITTMSLVLRAARQLAQEKKQRTEL